MREACQRPRSRLLRRQNGEGSLRLKFADLLTAYRLAAAPVAAWMAIGGNRDAFFVLIIISFITDLVDGPIARWMGQETEFGAKLDTIADSCTVLAGILGLYLLEFEDLRPDLPWLYLFLATYGAAAIACLAKFGRPPAYHLYLSKTAEFCAGAFIVWLYAVGYSRQFFLALLCVGTLANLESLLTTLRLKRYRTDVGSLLRLKNQERDRTG